MSSQKKRKCGEFGCAVILDGINSHHVGDTAVLCVTGFLHVTTTIAEWITQFKSICRRSIQDVFEVRTSKPVFC